MSWEMGWEPAVTPGMTSLRDSLRHPDEIEENDVYKRFALSYYQLGKLPARRLSKQDSLRCGSWRHKLTFYKVANLEALSEQVKRRKVEGHPQAAALPEATDMEWNFADSGGGDIDEIDEMKVAEHYKLPAPKLLRLPYRKLPQRESAELGREKGRVKVYKLSDIFQLVTDLRTQADSKFEASAVRRDQKQEAKQAEAFEAASKAKALVKTWKKPHLGPGRNSLPVEIWGLVLEQLLTDDSLWDLQGTVQELCSISLTSKGLYAAVQQQGWPQLCQLLSPLPAPPSTQVAQLPAGKAHGKTAHKGQLPDNPNVLVADPASLRMPELKAACAYYGLPLSGTKPELAVRILARFQLARPCAAPLLVVAYSRYHAVQMLSGLEALYSCTWHSHDTRFTDARREECRQLTKQWVFSAPQALQEALIRPAQSHLSAHMQHEAQVRAAAAALGLRKVFRTFAEFFVSCQALAGSGRTIVFSAAAHALASKPGY